jgi:hypothetical protein
MATLCVQWIAPRHALPSQVKRLAKDFTKYLKNPCGNLRTEARGAT